MAHDNLSAPDAERAIARSFLSGGGELGALIRAYDWEKTPLGPPERWPQGLRTAVRIMLTSRQPFWIGWGKELTYLYNDPYKAIIGGKHPWALGQPIGVVWREIWDDIAPLLDTAMTGVEGTYVEAKLLIMERHGYPEETYYTFSYSPIPDGDGAAGGIICANTDDTQRVIGERQLALLRELAAGTANARSWQEACEQSARALATNPRDLPFAMVYSASPDGETLSPASLCGIAADHPAAPGTMRLDGASPWPLGDVLRKREARLCDLRALPGKELPTGAWSVAPTQAAVLPIPSTGEQGRASVLIVGLSPFRRYDEGYRGFLELVAGQIGAAIANVQAYEAERRRAEALAEIDRAKTLFFSNVSHEFRTPLTLMLGPLEDALSRLARDGGEVRPLVETAHRNGLRLLNLVNSLLDFSRIEAGRVEASYEPTDLASVTADLASGFRSAVDKAGLRLVVDCARLPEPVYVDRDMWEKLVLNLISNAFKFTFDGEIEVAVGPSSEGTAAEMTVRDTGTGIPAHELPRLFERFHRIEGAKGRSMEGSGIGLALVHELVKLHGGTIRVESEPGRGSAFTVSLPFGTAHLPADRLSRAPARPSTGQRAQAYADEALRWLPDEKGGGADRAAAPPSQSAAEDIGMRRRFAPGHGDRVLLADDNADMRDYVSRLLGEQGYVVEAVPDGQAALASARRMKPDLVLSDVMMPGLDGFGLLHALRAEPALREVPVVLLSARAGEEAQVEGLDAGADDYLTKPFSARELLARVGTNLLMARLRREAAEALRARTDELETLLETVPTAVWFTRDPDAAHISGNRQAASMLRLSEGGNLSLTAPGQVRPRHFRLLRNGSEVAPQNLPMQRAARGEEVRGEELELRFDDGGSTIILVHATPLRDARGDPVGAVAAGADITAHKQAQEVLRDLNQALEERVAAEMKRREQAEAALRQSQKMEAIGQLTGGVAHDFNNLLLVIQGNLEALERQAAKSGHAASEPMARPIRAALKGVERATILNHRLLAFARQQPLAPESVDANKLVGGMSELLHRTLGESVAIETVLSSGLWRIFADANQLENAILNLAVNARDAMPDGGKLTIETANAFLDEAYAAAHHEVAPGQYVSIAVSDTGIGMSKEGIEKAFEPFYTTKGPGLGTGLGLSQVYGFAKQSGGHAKIYSELGHGATVRLYLPRHVVPAGEMSKPAAAPERAPPRGHHRETILVVEDDDDVRANSVRSLRELGYRVVEARDGAAALRVLEREAGVDLIFTDVGLPGGVNGRQIADEARRRWPKLRVLFTTGYARNAIVHHGRLDPGVELIVKPYTFPALARRIRAALDRGA